MSRRALCLIVALPAEARPISRHFALKRDPQHARFPLYKNGKISLVVSGVGKERAFAATRWLHHAMVQSVNSIWLNLGIAGHPERKLGEAVIASRVTDLMSGESWNLKPPTQAPFVQNHLITLLQPAYGYQRQSLHDMEASGFCSAAFQFASPERIMVIKIISDNSDNSTNYITGKMVSHLIEQQLGRISQLIEKLV